MWTDFLWSANELVFPNIMAALIRTLRKVAADPGHIFNVASHLRMILTRNSIFHTPHELSMAGSCPTRMLTRMLELFQPRSILDLGQGTGQTVEFFLKSGITDVVGVEGSPEAIAASPHPEKAIRWNLNETLDLGRTFDLVYSFEVVEHIHPRFVENLLRSFSHHGDRVVITAARPGQGGAGHFNEQPPEYWIVHFQRKGYRYAEKATAELKACNDIWADNLLVFER
jgi:SAM-dependent methyltransferase